MRKLPIVGAFRRRFLQKAGVVDETYAVRRRIVVQRNDLVDEISAVDETHFNEPSVDESTRTLIKDVLLSDKSSVNCPIRQRRLRIFG